ncbi:ABC transporter ATP-binding protein [Companilactobacillus zhachilii]|uniref:ABC transporter ATP-binding protein n=1 Tax=Companilactobacillus zhachilii TaxID=2304606 RepID=UPI001921456F|nr:ABC transporter ATP-binding protein [Companilactobacillus zhachilii]MBL3531730.1 ABC transporter ATP-binding protein [Companilactobacillus zhachilii]
MTAVLSVQHLSKTFSEHGKGFHAVEDISFTINKGEIVSLLGPNGAGKTTTVSMVGGYLMPTAGEIFINGVDRFKSKEIPNIGVMFGGDLGFYGRATAKDNLLFFADLAKISSKERQVEVGRVLELVDLKNVADKKVQYFSKGMKQRLHIARSLLGNPPLLLLDEPTSGLDVEIANDIRKIVHTLKQNGTAILLTSHTMSEVESLADRILLLGGGKIFDEGTVEEIIAKSNVHHIDRPATLEESYLALAPELRRK